MVTVSVCYSYFCHSNRKLLLYCTIIQGVNKSLNNFIFRWDAAQRLKKLLASDYSEAPKNSEVSTTRTEVTNNSDATKKSETSKRSEADASKKSMDTKKPQATKKSEAPKRSSSAPKSTPKTTTTSAATLNKRNMKGETLLHRECIKGNVEKVRAVYHSLCPQLNNN